MRSLPALMLALVTVGTIPAGPAGEDERRQIDDLLEKALKARGGRDLLKKFGAAKWKDKNTMLQGDRRVEFQQEGAYCLSGRSRTTTNADDFSETSIYDGKRGWIRRDGKTEDMGDAQIKEEREMIHVRRVTALFPLQDKEFGLSWLGEVEVDKKPALGILVKHKDFRDVKLFFDNKSHLLVLRETVIVDQKSGKSIPVRMLPAKYRAHQGLICPTAYRIELDDVTVESELKEFEPLEKLEDQLFKKP